MELHYEKSRTISHFQGQAKILRRPGWAGQVRSRGGYHRTATERWKHVLVLIHSPNTNSIGRFNKF